MMRLRRKLTRLQLKKLYRKLGVSEVKLSRGQVHVKSLTGVEIDKYSAYMYLVE